MAYKLTVDIVDADGEISLTHTFWGSTEKEVEAALDEHAALDQDLTAAQAEGRTIEDTEEIDDEELPQADSGEGDEEEGDEL
jgi:hypothetical protein